MIFQALNNPAFCLLLPDISIFKLDVCYKIAEAEACPLVFVPMVNFARLNDPSIIDAF